MTCVVFGIDRRGRLSLILKKLVAGRSGDFSKVSAGFATGVASRSADNIVQSSLCSAFAADVIIVILADLGIIDIHGRKGIGEDAIASIELNKDVLGCHVGITIKSIKATLAIATELD